MRLYVFVWCVFMPVRMYVYACTCVNVFLYMYVLYVYVYAFMKSVRDVTLKMNVY